MKSLVSLTRGLVGKQYSLGTDDCFSLIIKYLRNCGIDIPGEYMGLTMETYADLFRTDPARAKEVMVALMDELMIAARPEEAFAGDILLLALNEAPPFLAIHSGNGRVLAATEGRGVCQLSINRYEIVRVWRCRQQSRLQ